VGKIFFALPEIMVKIWIPFKPDFMPNDVSCSDEPNGSFRYFAPSFSPAIVRTLCRQAETHVQFLGGEPEDSKK